MKKIKKTKEPQYDVHMAHEGKFGAAMMGLTASYLWMHDPKHVLFTLSRYKFVARLLDGKARVAEIGCGDAFGTRVVAQGARRLDGFDFDPVFIENARRVNRQVPNATFHVHDILRKPLPRVYDAAYALDVLEHIPKRHEKAFMTNIVRSLAPQGVLITGTPNITSQVYASAPSRLGHVNCKSAPELRELFARYFHNVFVFSMNDEVVHTGFAPMAHYLFTVGVGKRASGSRPRKT